MLGNSHIALKLYALFPINATMVMGTALRQTFAEFAMVILQGQIALLANPNTIVPHVSHVQNVSMAFVWMVLLGMALVPAI